MGFFIALPPRTRLPSSYNAGLAEIRAVVPMPDGTVYAAALGDSPANQAAKPAAQPGQGLRRHPAATPASRSKPRRAK